MIYLFTFGTNLLYLLWTPLTREVCFRCTLSEAISVFVIPTELKHNTVFNMLPLSFSIYTH